ncbi:jg15113 [Pararge aegeria aegeria]|uniref:Jg15113 protein n=1 Tax=Pararge aegeria aegeria TaxID=348720 RepID=A0A8S4RGE0_9NEOP|nr:jg15113 [Pararge aegeria aegeria]
MERSMTEIRKQVKVRSSVIKEKTKVADILTLRDQLKRRWAGHMIQGKQKKWSTTVAGWYPRHWKRSRERQQVRWADDLKLTTGLHWRSLARDRTKFKIMEEAFAKRHTELPDI